MGTTSGSWSRRPLDEIHLPQHISQWMHRAAIVGGLGALVMFSVMAYRVGVPESTYFDQWEAPAQIGLLAAAAVGYLLALRWPGLGGAIMMQAAVGVGVLASIEYEWLTSLVACLAFFIPGALFVLSWQRTQTVAAISAVFLAVAVLLGIGWYASSEVYGYYFGPTHPESKVDAPPIDLVEWTWSGGVTQTSAVVTARLHDEHDNVDLLVSTSADFSDSLRIDPAGAIDERDRIVSFSVEGLEPATDYYYAVEADGELEQNRRGTFETFPTGQASFTFAFSSCARTGSNGSVFDAIRENDPLLYLITGDFNYENISSNDPDAFLDAYQKTLTSPAQAALYQSTPVAYVWDDHDYGGNNADSESASRPAAIGRYQQIVPHYETPDGPDGAIYQTFAVGRVRFIITDSRSQRTPSSAPDDAQKTMLGAEQKSWFKEQLLDTVGNAALIVWVNADPWIAKVQEGGDSWDGYDTERQELATFITDNGIDNILMASGDAHMLAIDDGTNSAGEFPVFHAAALDRRGRVKGGPYSEGTYPDGGQFGLVTVNDSGDQVQVVLSGRNYRNQEVVGYSFTVDAADVPLNSSP
jgi:hypothetical protein